MWHWRSLTCFVLSYGCEPKLSVFVCFFCNFQLTRPGPSPTLRKKERKNLFKWILISCCTLLSLILKVFFYIFFFVFACVSVLPNVYTRVCVSRSDLIYNRSSNQCLISMLFFLCVRVRAIVCVFFYFSCLLILKHYSS